MLLLVFIPSAKTTSAIPDDCGDGGMLMREGGGRSSSSSSSSRKQKKEGEAVRGTTTRTTRGGRGNEEGDAKMGSTANSNTVSDFLVGRRAMDEDRSRIASSAIMTTTKGGTATSIHPSESEDHPSNIEVRTHRTCSLCLRNLPRSQFSEGARHAVNASLSPGVATCRTCTMTVCAVKLRCMPDNDALLDGYARRGMTMLLSSSGNEMMGIGGDIGGGGDGRPPPRIAGYLGDGSDHGTVLVPRRAQDDPLLPPLPQTNIMVEDVNSVFYGDRSASSGMGYQYRHRRVPDVDRPANVADCRYLDVLFSMPSYLNVCAFGIFGSSRDISVSVAALEAVRLHGTLSGGGDGGGQTKGGGGCFVPHDCDGRPAVAGQGESGDGTRNERMGRRTKTDDNEKVDDDNGAGIDPRSVVCLVLGEGPTPRTAILASQHYGWTTYAIDANLSDQWIGCQDDVPGFVGYAGSIGDFMVEEDDNDDRGGGGGGTRTTSSCRFGRPPPGVAVCHLVIIGIQPTELSEPVRMDGNGHINEVRSRYDDVPTTLTSLSPVRGTTTSLAPPGAERRYHANRLQKDLGYAPNHWYVDEGVFSECREVKVWNFHNSEDDEDDYDDGDDNINDGDDDIIDFEGRVTDDEEGLGSKKIIKKRGNVIPEKKGKESRRHSPGGRMGDRSGKSIKNEIKKNDWLEERVAQFKINLEEKIKNEHPKRNDACTVEDKKDHVTVYDNIDDASFDDTLSTKSFKSNHTRNIVDKPGGVGVDREVGVDRLAEEINSDSLSPQEVAKVLDIMAMHEEQELFCKPSDEVARLDESHINAVKYDDNTYEGRSPKDDEDDMLPDNWEAIFDPESGDYYYTNWDTSEVTWDRPGPSPRLPHDEEISDAATDSNDAPPLVGHQKSHDVFDLGEDDEDSAHVLIDDGSIHSAIAALNRWNEPVVSPTISPGMRNGIVDDDDDDMITWSDDEGGDHFDPNPTTIKRSRSNPWHRNEYDESQNSFVYE